MPEDREDPRETLARVTPRPVSRINAWVVGAALLAAALRMSSVLFAPPIVGLANNGDFERVMARVGLSYVSERYEERYWCWAVTKFAIADGSPFRTSHLTTEVPLAWAAVSATRLLTREPVFDIRALGALHAALFLAAGALLLRACRDLAAAAQWLAALLLVFVFTDVGYTDAFNSLYGQTSSLLALLWIVAVAATVIRAGGAGRAGAGWLAAYFLAAAWFVGSKPQEVLHAPLLAIFGVALAGLSRSRRRILASAALGAGLCLLGAVIYRKSPRFEIHDVGVYHSVFMDLLPTSGDPARELRALGLDPELARFSGIHAYKPEAPLAKPEFREQFFARIGYPRLVGYYLARPGRLWDRLERAGRQAFRLRPVNLGDRSRDSSVPCASHDPRASAWSRARLALGPVGLFAILALLLGSLAVAFKAPAPAPRILRVALALLVVLGAVELGVSTFADDLGDASRHLYLFQAVFDLLLLIVLVWATQAAATRRAPTPRR